MQIYFQCPHCETRLEIEAVAAEQRLACPGCGNVIRVPRRAVGPGMTVGGFRILELVGQGGMGLVYRARQLAMEREVALKILPPHLTQRPSILERFLNEVRVAARLDHPHIVTAHAAGEDEGVYYLAMSFVQGETLERILKRDGARPEPEALRIIAEVVAALRYAWQEHRLIHRDIKPANIMLDRWNRALLMDMGLSKSLAVAHGLTVRRPVMGSPHYMSPEQARGQPVTDVQSDMYALGATLYHLVTGQIPFGDSPAVKVLQRQINEALPDPRDYQPALSKPTVKLLAMLLQKNPARRPLSWDHLAADLVRVRHGHPPTGRPLAGAQPSIYEVPGARPEQENDAPRLTRATRNGASSRRRLLRLALSSAVMIWLLHLIWQWTVHGPRPMPPEPSLATALPNPAPAPAPDLPPNPTPPLPAPAAPTVALAPEPPPAVNPPDPAAPTGMTGFQEWDEPIDRYDQGEWFENEPLETWATAAPDPAPPPALPPPTEDDLRPDEYPLDLRRQYEEDPRHPDP
ncbi:MAG: protein kinase [Candidatus Marinimicrobia bacterium]|nr:protein kinase [Candidatus Neomarinimicrobiota bacterium]